MATRRRRPANKGKSCKRFKRVRSIFGGTVKRCASFGAGRRLRRKTRKGKSRCAKGVNKVTGKCLKRRRTRR